LVVSCVAVTDFDNFLIVLFNTRTSEPMSPAIIADYKQILQNEYEIDGDQFYYSIVQDPDICPDHTHP
jgi:hypothetical protein